MAKPVDVNKKFKIIDWVDDKAKSIQELHKEGWESCGVLLRCKNDRDVYILIDDKKGVGYTLRTD